MQRDTIEARNAVQIDQDAGLRQPHIERGHQALPAREQLGSVAMLTQKLDRVLDRTGLRIRKRRRLHATSPESSF
jgi:hypothetical protein